MNSWLGQLVTAIRENGLDRHPRGRALLGLAQGGRMSESHARAHLMAISNLIKEQTTLPTHFLPAAPDADTLFADGDAYDINLGNLENNLRGGIHILRHVRHLITAGATGTGKSVLLRNLILQTRKLCKRLQRNISIIVLDVKSDFTDICRIADGQWVHYDAATTSRFGFQNPAGVPVDTWRNLVATSFAARAGMIAARISLARMIGWLCNVMNSPGNSDLAPNPQLLLDVLRATPPSLWAHKSDYGNVLNTALDDISENTGQLFHCFRGLDINRDIIAAGRNAVINLRGLTLPWVRAFLIDLIIHQIFQPRVQQQQKTDSTEVLLVVDEADEFTSQENEGRFPGGIPPLNLLLKQGREFGVGVAISVSALNNVSPLILANCASQYFFNQADAKSLSVARESLLLPRGAEDLLSKLPPGVCLARNAMSCWPQTVLMNVDFVQPYRGGRPVYDSHLFVPSQRLADMPAVQSALQQLVTEHDSSQIKRNRSRRLAKNARSLLDIASLNPYSPVARLWALLNIKSPTVQQAAHKQLRNRHLASFSDVRVGSANVLLMLIQEAGYELLGKPMPAGQGRGHIEHSHFAHWIYYTGKRRGYRAELEWIVPGTQHPVDVAWSIDGKWHVFEVVSKCDENIVQHLLTTFGSAGDVANVTIVAAQKKILNQLQTHIAAEQLLQPYQNRIQYAAVELFMKEAFE